MTFLGVHDEPRRAARFVTLALSAVISWIGRQMERRRTRLALLEMTDEQLKDIGLSRSEAFGLARSATYAEALRRRRE
jgi:uncharacterized protein YjiS (DUF1127 family)